MIITHEDIRNSHVKVIANVQMTTELYNKTKSVEILNFCKRKLNVSIQRKERESIRMLKVCLSKQTNDNCASFKNIL